MSEKLAQVLKTEWSMMGIRWGKMMEWLAMKIAWKMPKRIVNWCYIRVGIYATSGEWGDTDISEIGMMEAYGRWERS